MLTVAPIGLIGVHMPYIEVLQRKIASEDVGV